MRRRGGKEGGEREREMRLIGSSGPCFKVVGTPAAEIAVVSRSSLHWLIRTALFGVCVDK